MIEIEQWRADRINETKGNLEGYDCTECLNRGYFARVDDQARRYNVECKCMTIRRSIAAMKRSGLASLLDDYTFAKWECRDKWHSKALELAERYISGNDGRWFMMAGNSGSGKTHLCTAICGELMRQGRGVKYMLWRDVSVLAKAVVNDDEEYRRIVDPLKNVPVLYIDDLFKAGRDEKGKLKITAPDISFAFEVINHRYNDKRKLTIISSELSIEDILGLDEAVGSRIYERTRGFYIPLDNAKNWRMG
jgi:DNA replication protein DnaC